jgi:hypothetical protein
MNNLIVLFMNVTTGMSPSATAVTSSALSPITVGGLDAPMILFFSHTFSIILLAHLFLGAFGWFFVLVLIWCAFEIIKILFGAIITYIKSVVGLMFLFAIAPIFFCFLFFEQTKRIFMGWLNQVFGFFLQPVLLFAFLGFFMALLVDPTARPMPQGILLDVMFPGYGTRNVVDFCWVKWFPLGLFDIYWWRPVSADYAGGNYPQGTWEGPAHGDNGASPTSFSDLLYLLFIIHVGKVVIKFLEHTAHDLSGGMGPGIVRSTDVGRFLSNHLPGVKGRRLGELTSDLAGGALYRGRNAFDRLTGRRPPIGEPDKPESEFGMTVREKESIGGSGGSRPEPNLSERYATLGLDYNEVKKLSRDEQEKVIRKAFREKSREYHPDLNPNANTEEKFKDVSTAHDAIIKDMFGSSDDNDGGGPGLL